MGVVSQKFSSDISQVEAAYSKLQAENAKLINQNKQLTKESEKASRAKQGSMELMRSAAFSALTSVTSMMTSYVSVQGAIALVNRELEDQLKNSQKLADFAAKVAPSQVGLAINLGKMGREEKQAFLAEIAKINTETEFGNLAVMNAGVGALVSGTGNKELSLNVARHLGQILRSRPDEFADTAGAVGDLATIIGDDQGEMSLALVQKTLESSRLVRASGFKNVAQGIANMANYNETGSDSLRGAEVSAGLLAALSRGMKDDTGAVTSTAGIALTEQLQKLLPDEKTLEDRIARVQSDAALRDEFLSTATFEKKAGGVVAQLLSDPESQVARDYAANIAAKTDIGVVSRLKEDINTLTPQTESDRFVKGVDAGVEEFMTKTDGHMQANIRQMLVDVLPLTRTGTDGWLQDQRDLTLGFDLPHLRSSVGLSEANDANLAALILRDRMNTIIKKADAGEINSDELGWRGAGRDAVQSVDTSRLNEEQMNTLILLNSTLEKLERISGNMERNAAVNAALSQRGAQREGER